MAPSMRMPQIRWLKVSSGLVHLHKKGTLAEESLSISNNWLIVEGAVSSKSTRPQMPNNQKHMFNR